MALIYYFSIFEAIEPIEFIVFIVFILYWSLSFIKLVFLPFNLFLKGSINSFLGNRLLLTMCFATLFRIFFPKLLKAFDKIIDVMLAKLLNSSTFFRLVLSFSTYLIFISINFKAL